jgi:hypothetical protein
MCVMTPCYRRTVRGRVVIIVIAGAGMILGGAALLAVFRSPSPAAPATAPPAAGRAPAPAEPTAASEPRPAGPKAGATVEPKPGAIAPAAAAPTTGTLRIESDVPGTSVFIDRVYLGTAPVTASNLAPGSHKLNMSAAGYDGVSETIEVALGTHDLSIKFKEIRLDATLDVVHRHAPGSCTGTLRATPHGLQYDTTDKNDGFTAALTDLETFEVDYMKKILKVKIRKGRTYTFTDPEGNADRLFVFQRDVEKVRQRVLAGR